MTRKLMKCKVCGNTQFNRNSRSTDVVVQIWDDGLGLEDDVLDADEEVVMYDYKCTKCGKSCED